MLKQAKWADFVNGQLIPMGGVQPLKMQHSDGTALPLVLGDSTSSRRFGADLIRFPAGGGVGLHTHVGEHTLMVTKGEGILIYGDEKHEMFPGMIYFVPSNIPHAIEAATELVLIALGNDHRPADSLERLDVVQKGEDEK